MTWDDRYEALLRAYGDLLDEGDAIDADTNLQSIGLDSLTLVQLVVELEESFEVTLPDEAFTIETFETAGSLWAAIDEARRADQLSSSGTAT